MPDANDNIPEQVQGQHTDVIAFADRPTQQEAHQLFLLAKDRLKDISQWHLFSGPGSGKFVITDARGNEVYKTAEQGDIFYIDLPAPGPVAGDGKEWVRIEAMEEIDNAEAESEYLTITVRPVANPGNPGKAVAHFFSHTSTNTFIVERYLNHVSAAAHDRNETPNTQDTGLFDTVRNTITALTARKGLSVPQWKSLVEGILSYE